LVARAVAIPQLMESESINKQIVVVAIESVVENRISNPQDVAVAVEVDHGN